MAEMQKKKTNDEYNEEITSKWGSQFILLNNQLAHELKAIMVNGIVDLQDPFPSEKNPELVDIFSRMGQRRNRAADEARIFEELGNKNASKEAKTSVESYDKIDRIMEEFKES